MNKYTVISVEPKCGRLTEPHSHVIGRVVDVQWLEEGLRCLMRCEDGSHAILTSPIIKILHTETHTSVETVNTVYNLMPMCVSE